MMRDHLYRRLAAGNGYWLFVVSWLAAISSRMVS